MKAIEIQDDVFQALEKRARGFSDSPNDVIKRLLTDSKSAAVVLTQSGDKAPIAAFVETSDYLRGDAKERYFDVLRFLYKTNPAEFERFDGYRQGSRVLLSKTRE